MTKKDDSYKLLRELMQKEESGELGYNRIVYDAIVMEIDNKGAQFDGDNPVDSIKYRLITDLNDRFFKDVNLEIAWPLFGIHTRYPVKIGERIKILFEHPSSMHGWWFSTRRSRDNPNFKAWNDISEPDESEKSKEAFGKKPAQEDGLILSDVTLQKKDSPVQDDPHTTKQDVPQLLKSNDEHIEQGSNNSLTRYGKDRPGDIGSGLDAGAIDNIVGLKSENPNWKEDKGRDYLAEKSDIDKNLPNPSGIDFPAAPTKAIKADLIRLNANTNMVLWVGDTWISIIDGKVNIGGTKTNNSAGKGPLVTENSTCRHHCPFLKWAATNPVPVMSPQPALSTPPVTALTIPDGPTDIVESKFMNKAGVVDGSESNENVEILD